MHVYTSILPHQRALGPSHSLLPLPPPIAPHTLSLRRGPRSFLLSSSLRHSPTCTSYPVPHHPDIRVGVIPSLPLHPVPTLSVAQTTYRKPIEGSAPSATWGCGVVAGGAGVGEKAGPPCGLAWGSPARGSARSSPAASKSGRATAKSPTFLEPLESHLSDGGWGGVFFK